MRKYLLAYAAALTLTFVLAIAGAFLLHRETGPNDTVERAADEFGYNVATWEVQHFPRKWAYKLRHLFRSRSEAADERGVQRYFELAREIRGLERGGMGGVEIDAARRERDALEEDVEDVIEGRVTDILKEQGLALSPPLFTELGLVFPPVDFEFDAPPRVLVVSPRGRIELDRSFLLNAGLRLETVERIERDAEAENDGEEGVSVLVVNTGGVATYPSVVPELAAYESLVDTVFHEWVHQYLVFFPLGSHYSSQRTLNESVANIAGRELARFYFERNEGLEPPKAIAQDSAFDFSAEMRALRRRVESLLGRGRVGAAESLMAEKRDEFEEKGVFIRRLNQAYFAFHGFYADTAASIDPIGPKLEELLSQARSPGEFVRLAAALTNEAALDRLLSEAP